jgi:hypothetical protein
MSERERQRRAQQRHGSFTIREWCEHRRISEAMFYKLDQQGLAPRTYYVGKKRCVSDEADAAWVRAREAEAENTAAA